MTFKIKCEIYDFLIHVFYEEEVEQARQTFENYYKCTLNHEPGSFSALTVFPSESTTRTNDTLGLILGKDKGD